MPLHGIIVSDNKCPPLTEIKALIEAAYSEQARSVPDDHDIRNATRIITAHEGEKLVGLLLLNGDDTDEHAITGLCVHPSYQGMGLGQKLVERTIALHGHASISVETAGVNVSFFKKCGFILHQGSNMLSFCKHIAEPAQQLDNERVA